jgi:hypothetical protein
MFKYSEGFRALLNKVTGVIVLVGLVLVGWLITAPSSQAAQGYELNYRFDLVGLNSFSSSHDLSLDSEGNIFVIDYASSQRVVRKYSPLGDLLTGPV